MNSTPKTGRAAMVMERPGAVNPPTVRRLVVAVGSAALLYLLVVALRGAGRLLIVSTPIGQPDAIVSLASHEWERLPVAAALARQVPSLTVLLTEPAKPSFYNCHQCSERVNDLIRAGVEKRRIVVLPHKVSRTFDEAQAVREWAERHGARSVLVVTSPYHTRRALATFRRVLGGSGIRVAIRPAWEFSRVEPGFWWRHKYDRWYVSYEWSACLFYLVRFGVSPFES